MGKIVSNEEIHQLGKLETLRDDSVCSKVCKIKYTRSQLNIRMEKRPYNEKTTQDKNLLFLSMTSAPTELTSNNNLLLGTVFSLYVEASPQGKSFRIARLVINNQWHFREEKKEQVL